MQQLSIRDLALKSTAIVRCSLVSSYTATRGSVIYTHYIVNPSEQWKGPVGGQMDIAVPGGAAHGVRQTYAGSPVLASGKDYLLFLWKGPSGQNQVIGLSQGLFVVVMPASGVPTVMRAAATEPMLNATGNAIGDENFNMSLADFRTEVMTLIAKGGQ